MSTQVQWQARRQAQDEVDGDLFDVQVSDTINRFADSADLFFDDPNGTKKSAYPRGQRVELEVSTDGGQSFSRRAAGFVQDVTEQSDGSADIVKVSLVGYDHFLRVRGVYKTYTSTLLSDILEDLITNFTPINYVGGNVSVQNDKTVTWDLQGEQVDEVISRVASSSADEDYGVNDDFEFFFAQRETERAGSDIADGDWLDYRLPEQGRDAVNRVELFYGSGGSESRVIVEDRAAQRQLADRLGAPRNVVIAKEVTYSQISNESAAEDKAREILDQKSQILTGTVTTFGRYDMEPGDVFRLQISEKNIDADFRVAQIDYDWNRDLTTVTVAENTGDVEDILVELADDVRRVSARDADADAGFTQFLQLTSGVTASADAGFSEVLIDDDAFLAGFSRSFAGFGSPDSVGFRQSTVEDNVIEVLTLASDVMVGGFGGETENSTAGFGDNDQQAGFSRTATEDGSNVNTIAVTTGFLNQLRDVWQGETPSTLSHVALGSATRDAVSTDTALDAEVARAQVAEQSQPASDTMAFTAEFTPGDDPAITSNDIAEFGFFDDPSAGTMYLSGQNVAISPTRRTILRLRVTVTIDNDSERFGVITDTGQERLVDLFLGDGGHEPTDMAFGTGTVDADVTDTALGNKVIEKAVSFADRQRGQTDVTARLDTTEANGNDIAELGEENTANELLSRVVFEGISKTSDFEIDANHIFSARNA